eukprot:16344-Hanusia_phi.AAC.10
MKKCTPNRAIHKITEEFAKIRIPLCKLDDMQAVNGMRDAMAQLIPEEKNAHTHAQMNTIHELMDTLLRTARQVLINWYEHKKKVRVGS